MKEKNISPEELLTITGLTQNKIIVVLQDNYDSMTDLYVLVDALPGLDSHITSIKAGNLQTEIKWKNNASILKTLREEANESLSEQATKIGISDSELETIESGKISPSLTSFRKIQNTYPMEFKDSFIHIGVPILGIEVQSFLIRTKLQLNKLASKTRISTHRLHAIIDGKRPNQDEIKRLRLIIPKLPTWKPQRGSVQTPLENSTVEAVEAVEEVKTQIMENQEQQVTPLTFSEKNEIDKADESVKTLTGAASDFKYLTDEEKRRIMACEEALLRLANDKEKWRRHDLFPEHVSEQWTRNFLNGLVSSKVIERQGERRLTKFIGIQNRIEKLIYDPEWLIKLVAPSALSRVPNETSEDESSDVSVNEESESVPNELNSSLMPTMGVLDELGRLLPQYYDVLKWQHDRLENVEKSVVEINNKLDEIINSLRIK